MGQSRPRYVYFRCFQIFTEIVDFSRIRTQIVGVEGERADHLTVTTALSEYSVTQRQKSKKEASNRIAKMIETQNRKDGKHKKDVARLRRSYYFQKNVFISSWHDTNETCFKGAVNFFQQKDLFF